MRPWYVLRARNMGTGNLVHRLDVFREPEAPLIILSRVYDESLGDPLGSVDGWMPEKELLIWIQQRLNLLNYPPEFSLLPPPGWYRLP